VKSQDEVRNLKDKSWNLRVRLGISDVRGELVYLRFGISGWEMRFEIVYLRFQI
jgi:hypothetical protein